MKKLHTKSPKQLRDQILIITFVFLVILFTYGDIVASVKNSHDSITTSVRENQFGKVMIYLDELKTEAYNNAMKVSNNIENDIKDIANIRKLKDDMDNNIIPSELYDILESNAKGVKLGDIDNTRNGIFILSNSKVLVDFNYERLNMQDSKQERTFEHEKSIQWNKELYDNAITNILNKNNVTIAIETIPNDNRDHIKITDVSEKELKKVYIAEGIEGFKTYQFLVPAYITEDGDIFGQKDINKGTIQKNHKFIVIQEFNLYDQIMENHDEFAETLTEKELLSEHAVAVNVLNVFGCLLIGSYLIIIVLLVNAYNTSCLLNEENK